MAKVGQNCKLFIILQTAEYIRRQTIVAYDFILVFLRVMEFPYLGLKLSFFMNWGVRVEIPDFFTSIFSFQFFFFKADINLYSFSPKLVLIKIIKI